MNRNRQRSHTDRELSRLISAAVTSKDFCNLLLTNPATALTTGCNGEAFDLTPEEEKFILSLHASSLTDFASQINVRIAGTPSKTGAAILVLPAVRVPDKRMA